MVETLVWLKALRAVELWSWEHCVVLELVTQIVPFRNSAWWWVSIVRGQTHLCLNELGCLEHVSDETDILVVRDISYYFLSEAFYYSISSKLIVLIPRSSTLLGDFRLYFRFKRAHLKRTYHHMAYCASVSYSKNSASPLPNFLLHNPLIIHNNCPENK